jgi:hypothetical protein
MWDPSPTTLNTDTAEMYLSVRASNVLRQAEIKYLWQLVQCTERELLRLPNCGKLTVRELTEYLGKNGGFYLGSSPIGPELEGSLIWDDSKWVWRLTIDAKPRKTTIDAEFISGDYS